MFIDLHNLNRIRTFGNSMYPLLRDGDIVYYTSIRKEDIRVDDILVIRCNDRYITHRVVNVIRGEIVTKGDNVSCADRCNKVSEIIGIVYQVKRGELVFPISHLYKLQGKIYKQELQKVIKLLDELNVSYVVVSGLPVYVHYEKKYPNILNLDCDILMNGKALRPLTSQMNELGYDLHEGFFSGSRKLKYTFIKKKSVYRVVINFYTLPPIGISNSDIIKYIYGSHLRSQLAKEMISQSEITWSMGFPVKLLKREMLILSIALQIFHHNFEGYFRYVLLSKLITTFYKDNCMWDKSVSLIKKYKLDFIVYLVFRLLIIHFDTQIPFCVIERIQPRRFLKTFIRVYEYRNIWQRHSRFMSVFLRFISISVLSQTPWYKKILFVFDKSVYKQVLSIISQTTTSRQKTLLM